MLELIYSAEIAGHQRIFVLVMLSATLWYVAGLLGCALNGLRKFATHAVVQTAATLSTVVACVHLVPGGGLVGASLALCIGMGVRLVGSAMGLLIALRTANDEA